MQNQMGKERDENYYLRFRVEGSGECRIKGFGA